MSHWDNSNTNIGYAGMFEDQSSNDNGESDNTSDDSTAYVPSDTTSCYTSSNTYLTTPKRVSTKERIQNFFAYLFLGCGLLAAILFIIAFFASVFHADNFTKNCLLYLFYTIIAGTISIIIAYGDT